MLPTPSESRRLPSPGGARGVGVACAGALLLALAPLHVPRRAPTARALEKDEGATARLLLEDAYSRRHVYGDEFPGFEAKVRCLFGAGWLEGRVRVRRPGEVEVDLPDPQAGLWVREQLSIILSHRLHPRIPEAGRLRLDGEERPGLGRRILVRDDFDTAYRLHDGRIREVERTSPPVRFVVTIVEYARADDGKDLPRVFTAAYFDAASARLLRTFVFKDAYRQVGDYALPLERVVIGSADGGTQTARFELSEHALLEPRVDPLPRRKL